MSLYLLMRSLSHFTALQLPSACQPIQLWTFWGIRQGRLYFGDTWTGVCALRSLLRGFSGSRGEEEGWRTSQRGSHTSLNAQKWYVWGNANGSTEGSTRYTEERDSRTLKGQLPKGHICPSDLNFSCRSWSNWRFYAEKWMVRPVVWKKSLWRLVVWRGGWVDGVERSLRRVVSEACSQVDK